MSYLPCKNPNCNSYGQPHPNCRCYGEMAEGGDVHFCAKDNPHDQKCEYFKDGGGVGDFDSLQEDAPAPDFDELQEDTPPTETAKVSAPDFDSLQESVASSPPADTSDNNADLSPADLQAKIAAHARPNGPNQYETGGQQLATIGEGLARGVAGEAATLAENKLLGVPLEDIRGREAANPGEAMASEATGLVGGLATGTGEAALAAKGAEALAQYGRLGKLGSSALKGIAATCVPAVSDEASKMLLGEKPEHSALAVGAACAGGGLAGLIGGAAGSKASQKLTSAFEGKVGTEIESWMAGIGSAANPQHEKLNIRILDKIGEGKFSKDAFEKGKQFYAKMGDKVSAATKPISIGTAAAYGYHEAGIPGAFSKGLQAYGADKAGKFGLKFLNKYTSKVPTPVILKILNSKTTTGILDALDHAEKVASGIAHVDAGIGSLFGGTGAAVEKLGNKRDELEKWMEGGGVDQEIQQAIYDQHAQPTSQRFAKGGEVMAEPTRVNGVATHFPEQNILMQSTKARASNYLNGLRPSKHAPRLAFDDEPDSRRQKKTYQRALDVAVSPMSVLDEIRKGTVEPDDIKHLSAMFPEVLSLMQQKATEHIVKAQLDGKKPNYGVRQGLSMLLGTPLSGALLPQNIAAAQAVFASKKQQQAQAPQQSGGGGKPKGSAQSLSKSDRSYLTDDQALQQRQQRQS